MTRKQEHKTCDGCLFADICTNNSECACEHFTREDTEALSEYIEDLEMRHEEYRTILKELDEEDYE